jgi:prefoldin beta subunit
MNPEIQEIIGQIQMIQQNMHNLGMQRQQFQLQHTEAESALGELQKSSNSYKIIGNIMVASDTESLVKELQERKEMLSIRIDTIEKQESKLRQKAEDLQKDVLQKLENNPEKKAKKQNAKQD